MSVRGKFNNMIKNLASHRGTLIFHLADEFITFSEIIDNQAPIYDVYINNHYNG